MSPIPYQSVYWQNNVGGVNYAKVENIVELMELADCNNVDIRPIGGYARRQGAGKWLTHSNEITGIYHWDSPMQSTFTLFYSFDTYLYQHDSMALTRINERETLA